MPAATGRRSGALDVLARVTAIAAALRDRGLAPGDRVALMSPNRVDWILANLGILFAGGVTVPIYATQALDQVALHHRRLRCAGVCSSTRRRPPQRLRAAAIALDPIVFDAPPEQRDSLAAADRPWRVSAAGRDCRHSRPATWPY